MSYNIASMFTIDCHLQIYWHSRLHKSFSAKQIPEWDLQIWLTYLKLRKVKET